MDTQIQKKMGEKMEAERGGAGKLVGKKRGGGKDVTEGEGAGAESESDSETETGHRHHAGKQKQKKKRAKGETEFTQSELEKLFAFLPKAELSADAKVLNLPSEVSHLLGIRGSKIYIRECWNELFDILMTHYKENPDGGALLKGNPGLNTFL